MRFKYDLTGRRFGMLHVLRWEGGTKKDRGGWICECDCGTVKRLAGRGLRVGDFKSCGCSHGKHLSDAGKRLHANIGERLFRSVEKSDGCWLWTGAKRSKGYGYMSAGNASYRNVSVHRVSWELHKGPIPEGLCVCHRCDVRLCVNPDHLFLGTYEDNNRDRDQKGRTARGAVLSAAGRKHKPPQRDQNPAAKITTAQIVEIKRRRAAGERRVDLAVEFGVSTQTIYVLGKS